MDKENNGPFIRPSKSGGFDVGYESEADGYRYHGPTASVFADKHFIHIVTDNYEGHAMINVEAIPQLIEALKECAQPSAPSQEQSK